MISKTLKKMLPRGLRCFSSTDVPVYEKPYNPLKYEVLTDDLKLSTGYAFLDVEPMPRARIMKLGYLILDRVREVPEGTNLRLWFEERAKWVMEVTDETESIRELEKKLGNSIIEWFIQDFHDELKELEYYIACKVWEAKVTNPEGEQRFIDMNSPRINNKYGHFGKKDRREIEFLEAELDNLEAAGQLR